MQESIRNIQLSPSVVYCDENFPQKEYIRLKNLLDKGQKEQVINLKAPMPNNSNNVDKTPYTTFLFNGFATMDTRAKYAKIYNRSFIVVQFLLVLISFIALESVFNVYGLGLFFEQYCLGFANCMFVAICMYLLAYMFMFYKAGHEQILQDKSLFICECVYQHKWYLKVIFICLSIFSCMLCLGLMIFAYFESIGVLSIPLYLLVMGKPFLLRKILVYQDKLILQYRFYGNICIDTQNIGIASLPSKSLFLAAGLFHLIQHKDYVLCYHLIGLTLEGLTNRNLLIETINKQSGFDMANRTKISLLGMKRKII